MQKKNHQIHNTFGLKAVAASYVDYRSPAELKKALVSAERPFLHVGGGSNLLFSKPVFKGTVFHNSDIDVKELEFTNDSVLVRAGGGVRWDAFVEFCVDMEYYGAENLSLIPGEVGAAAVQNIGAYGAEVKDIIESVECMDTDTGRIRVFSNAECGYGYRTSIFKKPENKKYFVLSVNFRLGTVARFNLSYGALSSRVGADVSLETVRGSIVEMRREKLPDPEEIGSAGSFFMNPVVPQSNYEALLKEYPDMPHYDAPDGNVKLSAGWMIDRCGWKGAKMGRAGIYARQALVLVNLGGASAEEIMKLARAVEDSVKNKFGVELKPEVQIIG